MEFNPMLDLYSPFDTAKGTDFFVSEALAAKHQEPGLQQQPLFLPTPDNHHMLKRPSAPPHAPSKEADKAKKLLGMCHTTHFLAWELFQIVQVALNVRIFKAKYDEWANAKKAMGDRICKQGIMGSNALFKNQMNELLVWHEVGVSNLMLTHFYAY
jgi:hypothetical protein